jgi:hypothetical protein
MLEVLRRRANPRPHRLACAMVVRDEADVLAATLAHQLASGVDVIVAADNGSTDGTRVILERFASEGRLVWHEEPAAHYPQGEWMTRLVRRARDECGADWVLLADADEFWSPAPGAGDLKDVIARHGAPVLECALVNCLRVLRPGEPDEPPLSARDFAAVARPLPRPDVSTEMLARAPDSPDRDPLPPWIFWAPDVKRLAATRAVRSAGIGHSVRAAWWARRETATGLHVWHLPIRSLAQFARKARIGGAALARNPGYGPGTGYHWRRWHGLWQRGLLEAEYSRQTVRADALAARCAAGELAHPLERFWGGGVAHSPA